MEYSYLGGLQVSKVCFGTSTLGAAPLAEDASQVIGQALDLGINFFETSDAYGNRPHFDRIGAPPATDRATAEEILGIALKGHRDEVVLATKVGERAGADQRVGINKGAVVHDRWTFGEPSLTRYYIMKQIEQSLRRLGTDHIDIYYAHHPDPVTPLDETLHAFDDLIRQGKIRYAALSTYNAWRLVEVFWTCERLGLSPPICHQVPYNLSDRSIEPDVLPTSERYNLPLVTFMPLAKALFAGREYRSLPADSPKRNVSFVPYRDDQTQLAVQVEELAEQWGYSTAQVALAWIMSKSAVASVIVGAVTPEEVNISAGATDVHLDPAQVSALDALNPPRLGAW